jgi:hypothetical protein
VRISPFDILKFDGFRAQKREILRSRWIPTAMRKPSSLISCSHCAPDGAFSTSCASCGGIHCGRDDFVGMSQTVHRPRPYCSSGRGGRGSRPGRYFTTADTSKRELQSRTLQALQSEGYTGRGDVTVLSDGAEIMKRLPKALPQPAAHIIDWFHIAMKIQGCSRSPITSCVGVRLGTAKWLMSMPTSDR